MQTKRNILELTDLFRSFCAGFSIQYIHWYVLQLQLLLTAFLIFSMTNIHLISLSLKRLAWRVEWYLHFLLYWLVMAVKFFSWCLWQIAKGLRPLILGFILCASHSRTFSMLNGYGAPLQIYQHLEYHEDSGPGKIPLNTFQYDLFCACFVLVRERVV